MFIGHALVLQKNLNFVIFISVLLSFDKESSGVEGGGGLYKNLIQ